MIFRQITHDDLGCASYLIGDQDAGVAAVVDPKLDIAHILGAICNLAIRAGFGTKLAWLVDRDQEVLLVGRESVHRPYHDIDGIPDGLDPARPIAVICSSGQRGAVAASLLRRFGAVRVLHVIDGGVRTWRAQGGPVQERRPDAVAR